MPLCIGSRRVGESYRESESDDRDQVESAGLGSGSKQAAGEAGAVAGETRDAAGETAGEGRVTSGGSETGKIE